MNKVEKYLRTLTDKQLKEKMLLNARRFNTTTIMILLTTEIMRRGIFKNPLNQSRTLNNEAKV